MGCTGLMKRESASAKNRPFEFLWAVSCGLYAVVIAFLLSKRWKKRSSKTRKQKKVSKLERVKMIEYENKVKEIRKQISITKEEVELSKANRKLTKRGRRNRALIISQCKDPSVSGLISFMEKSKCAQRKLKKVYIRKKKQEQ